MKASYYGSSMCSVLTMNTDERDALSLCFVNDFNVIFFSIIFQKHCCYCVGFRNKLALWLSTRPGFQTSLRHCVHSITHKT